MKTDTIVAPVTPASREGAVNIIRISGSNALLYAKKLFISKSLNYDSVTPNFMYLGEVSVRNFKDKAFFMYCKAPKSYTGEDVVELHLHGGKIVTAGVIRELTDIGARPAEPGEFTKRAYLNGKIDLSEAEGIVDIINADSEAEVKQAYRLMHGEVSKAIRETSDLLIEAAANLEAALDYPEEIEEEVKEPTVSILKKVKATLENTLESSRNRRYITDGVSIAIVGLTNVGKSSLMNALLKDERAIVTNIAGTTRDILKESFMLGGIKINLLDTAGIRDSSDTVERIGVERAKSAMKGADLILFIMDTSQPETDEEKEIYSQIKDINNIRIANKGDISTYPRKADIVIEAKTGKNVENLINLIMEKIDASQITETNTLTRERHIFSVKEALDYTNSAINNFYSVPQECTLVDIRAANASLGQILGEDVSESVVDQIFSKFCVGK